MDPDNNNRYRLLVPAWTAAHIKSEPDSNMCPAEDWEVACHRMLRFPSTLRNKARVPPDTCCIHTHPWPSARPLSTSHRQRIEKLISSERRWCVCSRGGALMRRRRMPTIRSEEQNMLLMAAPSQMTKYRKRWSTDSLSHQRKWRRVDGMAGLSTWWMLSEAATQRENITWRNEIYKLDWNKYTDGAFSHIYITALGVLTDVWTCSTAEDVSRFQELKSLLTITSATNPIIFYFHQDTGVCPLLLTI